MSWVATPFPCPSGLAVCLCVPELQCTHLYVIVFCHGVTVLLNCGTTVSLARPSNTRANGSWRVRGECRSSKDVGCSSRAGKNCRGRRARAPWKTGLQKVKGKACTYQGLGPGQRPSPSCKRQGARGRRNGGSNMRSAPKPLATLEKMGGIKFVVMVVVVVVVVVVVLSAAAEKR
jgi:hypothetical protein